MCDTHLFNYILVYKYLYLFIFVIFIFVTYLYLSIFIYIYIFVYTHLFNYILIYKYHILPITGPIVSFNPSLKSGSKWAFYKHLLFYNVFIFPDITCLSSFPCQRKIEFYIMKMTRFELNKLWNCQNSIFF